MKENMENTEPGKMSIARALKEKERVGRRLVEARKLFGSCNSRSPDVMSMADAQEAYDKMQTLQRRFLAIKKAIARANAGISEELTEMLVVRAEIEFYKALDCREEDFKDELTYVWREEDPNDKPTCVAGKASTTRRVRIVFNTFMKDAERRAIVEGLEKRLDSLQDAVDAFNATHAVEIPA